MNWLLLLNHNIFTINVSVLFQDNIRSMLLAQNAIAYRSKQTNNIRAGYYFIRGRIGAGNIVVKQCPTGEMLAYHFTKPLQGPLFQKFRAEIKGIPTTTDDGEIGWDVPNPLNITPKAYYKSMENLSHSSVLVKIVIMIFQ